MFQRRRTSRCSWGRRLRASLEVVNWWVWKHPGFLLFRPRARTKSNPGCSDSLTNCFLPRKLLYPGDANLALTLVCSVGIFLSNRAKSKLSISSWVRVQFQYRFRVQVQYQYQVYLLKPEYGQLSVFFFFLNIVMFTFVSMYHWIICSISEYIILTRLFVSFFWFIFLLHLFNLNTNLVWHVQILECRPNEFLSLCFKSSIFKKINKDFIIKIPLDIMFSCEPILSQICTPFLASYDFAKEGKEES